MLTNDRKSEKWKIIYSKSSLLGKGQDVDMSARETSNASEQEIHLTAFFFLLQYTNSGVTALPTKPFLWKMPDQQGLYCANTISSRHTYLEWGKAEPKTSFLPGVDMRSPKLICPLDVGKGWPRKTRAAMHIYVPTQENPTGQGDENEADMQQTAETRDPPNSVGTGKPQFPTPQFLVADPSSVKELSEIPLQLWIASPFHWAGFLWLKTKEYLILLT